MTRKYLRFAAILAAVALFIGLALILSPQDAYADSPYPEPQNICIDCDPLNPGNRYFTPSALYYKGNGTFSTNSTGSIAYYNPDTGTLVLDQYDGASILVRNSAGKELKIVVWRDNTITSDRQFGIKAEGVELTLMTDYNDDESSLTINCDYSAFQEKGSGAGITNRYSYDDAADIIIDGNINLHVNYKAGNTSCGIIAGHDLIIQYGASVELNALFGEYQNSLCAAAYAYHDIIIDTVGVVNFSAAARDNWNGRFPGYAAYCKNGSFKIYPGAEYVALSSVGTNRALCNKTVSMMGIDGSGYVDLYENTKTYTARMYRNPEYVYTEWLPLNGYFFPDPSFRALARSLAGDYKGWNIVYDLSDDIDTIARSTVPEKYRDAYSLKGIEEFHVSFLEWENGNIKEIRLPYGMGYINGEPHYSSSLEDLYLAGNRLEELDLSFQTSLSSLYCGNNLLKTLDVSDCTALRTLSCSNAWTYISGYDPGPVYSDYETFNTISVLDVSMCPYLESLWCYGNNLKALELGNNSNLTTLHCYSYEEPLETLNLIGCPKLQNCYLYGEKDTQAQYFDNYDYYGSGYTAWMRIDGSTNVLTSAPSRYATLKTAYLSLEGKISINFKVTTTNSGLTAKLYYDKNGYELVKTIPLNNSVWHSEDGGYYLVTYDKIPAKEMTNKLMIMVFDSSGNQVMLKTSSNWWTGYNYSVARWCNNKINATNPVERDVMIAKALLNYGHYSQLALRYNDGVDGRPNKLANPYRYLFAEMNNVTANSAYDRITAGGKDLGAKSFVLTLESDTIIKLVLSRQVSVKIDGASVTPVAEVDSSGTGVWAAYSNGVAAKQLHERKAFTLTEGSNSATMYYGCLSWANSKLANGSENDKNLAKAMYLYNYAARKYFNYDAAGL